MTVPIGTQIASHEITGLLGRGGMGEVYRARDRKLNREVAIKILPEEFSRDPDRVSRFQREAQVLASLNHPNIAQIYGFEESDTRRCIVMELVEGETLEQRLKRGPIPLDETLAAARQIAGALRAAHEKGIIHRDLKPANIKITSNGVVKVLDFGLAKAFQEEWESSPSDSPTLAGGSMAGMILGTAAYMSPEQVKGRAVDKQSDIWAFGAVLYEMLSGRRAFDGDDVSEILAAVLKTEPNWALLPPDLPLTIRRLIERCLAKDTKQRITDIAVAQFLLTEPVLADRVTVANVPEARRGRGAIGIAASVLAIVAVVIAVFVWLPSRTPERRVTRFAVLPPPGGALGVGLGYAIALSPDGSRLVYVGRSATGASQLYARTMDQLDAAPIRGSEGASSPFFSPDAQWIGFFSSDGKMKKVPVSGGTALTICDANIGYGATWLSDDSIVFSNPGPGDLYRVPAAGGKPQELLKPNRSKSEIAIEWPEAIPDGKTILFEVESVNADPAIAGFRLDTGERFAVMDSGGGATPQYLSSGHIVFGRANELLAIPFDLQKLQVRGRAVPVLEGVFTAAGFAAAAFRASHEGSIAYFPATQIANGLTLVWADRRGGVQPLPAPKRNYQFPRLSPDGQRIAVRIQDTSTDIWLYQIARGTLSRFTSNENDAETPVWSPDGKRVAYAITGSNPARQIVWRPADGGAGKEVIAGSERHLHLGGWSPNSQALIATATDNGSLWTASISEGKGALQPFIQGPSQLRAATIAPNGRWIAYASNETGRFEIYVQAFPNPGAKYQISTDGGAEPVWAKNGRELFYRNGEKMMAVTIAEKEEKLEAGTPALLFEGRFAISTVSGGDAWYDVSPDGNRFLMLKNDDAASSSSSIVVVQDWASELKRLAPAK